MSNWQNIAKPTGQNWKNVQAYLPSYDEAGLTYDAVSFYDGTNAAAWANVAKPVYAKSVTVKVGMSMGLIMPLTNSKQRILTVSTWVNINKPT